MLADLYNDPSEENEDARGFLTRDLIRFFLVDIILIIATRLLVGLGVVTHPDLHVGIILAGKIVLLVYLFWLIRDQRDSWPETGAATIGKWWTWPASIGLYALAYPMLLYIDRVNRILMVKVHAWFGLEYTPTAQDVMILIFENILGSPVRIVLIVFVVVIGPFMEELAFRGVGIDAYRRTSGTFRAVAVTSILFGLYHFNLNLIIPLSFLGLIFGITRVFSRSLWCSVMIHCLHNAVTLSLMAYELGLLDAWLPAKA